MPDHSVCSIVSGVQFPSGYGFVTLLNMNQWENVEEKVSIEAEKIRQML